MEKINITELIQMNINTYSLKEIINIIDKEYQKLNSHVNTFDCYYIEKNYIQNCLDYWIQEISDYLNDITKIGNYVEYEQFIALIDIEHFYEISPLNESNYFKLLMDHYNLIIQYNEQAFLRHLKTNCVQLLCKYIGIAVKENYFLMALIEFLNLYEKDEQYSDMSNLQCLCDAKSSDEFFQTMQELIMLFDAIGHDETLAQLKNRMQCLMDINRDILMRKCKEIIEPYFMPVIIKKQIIDDRAVLELIGGNFRLSDEKITNFLNLLLSGDPSIEEVRFICSGIMYVDVQLENNLWHGKNIVVYAKAIRVCGFVTWDVSGNSPKSTPDKAGTAEDGNGINGECGECGESGGNVFIYANNMFQSQRFFIRSNGGNGGEGQNGGDGRDGKDGTGISYIDFVYLFEKHSFSNNVDAIKNLKNTLRSINGILGTINILWEDNGNLTIQDLINNPTRYMYVEAETERGHRIYFSSQYEIEDDFHLHNLNSFLLYKGSLGQPGGRGGMAGVGGQGGHSGEVNVQSDIVVCAEVGRNGKNGAAGKYGNNGQNGWDIAYINNQTLCKSKCYGKHEDKILELSYYENANSERIYVPYRQYLNSKDVFVEISSHPIAKPASTDIIERDEILTPAEVSLKYHAVRKKRILQKHIFTRYSHYMINFAIDLYQKINLLVGNFDIIKEKRNYVRQQQVRAMSSSEISYRTKLSSQFTRSYESVDKILLRNCLDKCIPWLNSKHVKDSPNGQDKQKYEESLNKVTNIVHSLCSFRMSNQGSQSISSLPIEVVKDTQESSNEEKNRRGNVEESKSQAKEFQTKKEEKFVQEVRINTENLTTSSRYTATELFGDRQLNPAVCPQIEVSIRTSVIGDVCNLVADVLHGACKVPLPIKCEADAEFADAEILKWVTALQIESKMYHARRGTGFVPEMDIEVAQRIQRTDLLLNENLVPLAAIVHQVGRFSVNGQVFVPAFNKECDFSYGRLQDETNTARTSFASLMHSNSNNLSAATNFRDQQGRQLHARIKNENIAKAVSAHIAVNVKGSSEFSWMFLQNPNEYPWVGLVEFVPNSSTSVPTFEQIVTCYANLKGRVSAKLNNAFDQLDLSFGQGKDSQLVYTSKINQTGMLEVWSPRWLQRDSLVMGAILNLGYPSPISDSKIAACTTVIDSAGGLETLANVLTKIR